MNSRRAAKAPTGRAAAAKADDGITIRQCHRIEEFEACIRVERAVWQSSDIDVVPLPLFVVAAETGGHVLGAFEGADLVGFTLAIAGWRVGKPFLHSHMTAVLEGKRDVGIGRRLKLFQREDALARGIHLVEWTFDPLVTKNAHFNFMRLGAIAKRYLPNAYGITTSPLHGSLPTDRLIAEWHLRSAHVRRVLSGRLQATPPPKKAIQISVPSHIEDLKRSQPEQAREIQSRVRAEFQKWFGKGYVAIVTLPSESGMDYILEPGSRV